MSDADRKRLVAILGMLGSTSAGERDNAARLAEQFRRQHGLTWAQLFEPRTVYVDREVSVDTPQRKPPPSAAGMTPGWSSGAIHSMREVGSIVVCPAILFGFFLVIQAALTSHKSTDPTGNFKPVEQPRAIFFEAATTPAPKPAVVYYYDNEGDRIGTSDDVIARARWAIRHGVDRGAVVQRLKDFGIDPGRLGWQWLW
jgi:hypothetical protein